jgi:transposase-like protein
MCASGGNWRTLKSYVINVWRIPIDHFDPHAASRKALERGRYPARPLSEILVAGSTFSRGHLKKRLYAEGLKTRWCELCGQGELWRGQRLSLILDHINGVRDDNRLENLRIVCPNCAATLETHCGRNVTRRRPCATCGAEFTPAFPKQRHCSRRCGSRSPASRAAQVTQRRVGRPPYDQLVAEIAATNWTAVGRKYGVSDNAIRKWVRDYERERASVEADGAAGVGVARPVGLARAEVVAAEPAVDRRAGGGAGEDGAALGRERVAAAGERDERVELAGDGVDGGVAEPRRFLVLRYRGEQTVGRERAVGERGEDLAFDAGEAGADVWQLLEQALERRDVEPRAGVG